ncbi:hypothetical protein [Halocatena pleomorpha]|uniref:Uncharacterized protein n=1 Tax=Halocatena pleomorpha TaxID=1785090 RepID=A0A3P3RCC9_9EURY|nr:hypothetical protein [Halocatena pleomorpha]RRJ30974.1 hypothetical protein EIK79_08145 [Halocatena pleomorpha]
MTTVEVDHERVGHVADTGVFVWIGGPQPDRPGPSKFETFKQLAATEGIVFTISQQAYGELTENTDSDYEMRGSFIETAIEDGWVTVAEPLDFTIGPVSTVLNRAEQLITQRDKHHQTATDARADASLLAIATQLIETEQTDQCIIYTTDKAQSETAMDLLGERYGDRIVVEYCVPHLDNGIAVEEFRRLWRE